MVNQQPAEKAKEKRMSLQYSDAQENGSPSLPKVLGAPTYHTHFSLSMGKSWCGHFPPPLQGSED